MNQPYFIFLKTGILAATRCWVGWFLLILVAPLLAAQDDIEEIQKLRLQRKFDLAEKLIGRLDADLGPRDFAEKVILQIELLKSKTARAFEEKSESRTESYQSVIDLAERFERQNQSNPNLILVEVQKAMTGLKFGELIRKEIEAGRMGSGKAGDKKLEEAFGLLRLADKQFEALDKKLALMIPGASRKTPNGLLNQRQLVSLQNQIRYQRVKTKLNRGMLYGSRDPDNRVAVLTSARNDLTKVIPLIEKIDPAWWDARLDLMRCLREVGEFRTAIQMLKSYPVSEASPSLQLAFRAEEIRLAIAMKQPKQAEKTIAKGRLIDETALADFDYALLEYFIYLSEQTKSDRSELQATIGKIVKGIEKQHGAYWGRRANMALIASARSTGASGSSTLILLAQELYRKQKYDEAIAQFEKAADAARKELDRKLELELRFQSVVIHRNRKQHKSVVSKSRSIAKQFGDTNRAASIHLIGILSAAELVRSGSFELKEYIKMIDFHLENWRHHPTVAHVSMFRGDFDFAQKNFVSAAMSYRDSVRAIVLVKGVIDLDGFEKSMNKLTLALRKWRLAYPGKREVKSFQTQFDGGPFFALVKEKTSDLEATLNGWATYALDVEGSEIKSVFEKLNQEPKPQKQLFVNLIRVAIRSNQFRQIRKRLGNITLLEPNEVNLLLESFELDWPTAESVQRKAMAECVGTLSMTTEQQSRYWELLSQCYLESGKRNDAVKLLETMVAEKPNSLDRQLLFARTLSNSTVIDEIQRGLLQWRIILARSKERTESWYEAKYEIARCHLRLENMDEARDILDVMKSIPPGWTKSKIKDRFDELYRRVSKTK